MAQIRRGESMKANHQNQSGKMGIKRCATHYSLLALTVLLLASCGYKPVSHYTQRLFIRPLYLQVILSRKDPDSGVFLKDAMREAVIHRLGGQITDNVGASDRLDITYKVLSFDALGYDTHGYVERYRVNLKTYFDLIVGGKHIQRMILTTHEADVTPSALESSKLKREAIRACAVKAVDQFIAFLASHETHK